LNASVRIHRKFTKTHKFIPKMRDLLESRAGECVRKNEQITRND